MTLRRCDVWLSICLLSLTAVAAGQDSGKQYVVQSSHNLSTSGTGPIRATTETQVCIFCHIPHTANPGTPLWNHAGSSVTYNVYSSTTMDAAVAAPSESSKLCLSCHDGTIALGQTASGGNISVVDTTGTLLDPDSSFSSTASPNLGESGGSNLMNDHPVSFVPTQDGLLVSSINQAAPNSAVPEVKLRKSKVECVSCHDPHRQDADSVVRKFLVGDNRGGRLCEACHQLSLESNYWNLSAHATSTKTTPTSPADAWAGYGTVAGDSCMACHATHSGTVDQRLLRASEENTCFLCHGNSDPITKYNMQAEFNKVGAVAGVTRYAHPTVEITPSVHNPAELPPPISGYPRPAQPTMPETSASQPRHAECVDCHNPHAANSTSGSTVPPAVESTLIRVTGVSGTATDGRTPVTPAAYQYQICFVCHADSANKPQTSDTGTVGIGYGRNPQRQIDQGNPGRFNTRLEFNSLVSRHPVVNPRQRTNAEVPSLRPYILNLDGSNGRSLATGAYIYCTDCHNNNQARSFGGSGPNGPHSTIWSHLLDRRYEMEPPPASPGGTTSGVVYSPGITGTYALCDMCHDIANGILLNQSFKRHSEHVLSENASCATCHDPHGINGGNNTNNPSLINFDLSIVGPDSMGRLEFDRTGTFSGRCYLRCHGVTHTGWTY